MDDKGIIGRWAVLLLAEVLNLSASVAETLLMGQPRWLAQVRLLEENLRESARPARQPSRKGPKNGAGQEPEGSPAHKFMESYAILNRALKDIEARGLALDDALLDRMEQEWNTKSILGYLRTSDMQLRQGIGVALESAAKALGPEQAVSASHAERRGLKGARNPNRKMAVAGSAKTGPAKRKGMAQ